MPSPPNRPSRPSLPPSLFINRSRPPPRPPRPTLPRAPLFFPASEEATDSDASVPNQVASLQPVVLSSDDESDDAQAAQLMDELDADAGEGASTATASDQQPPGNAQHRERIACPGSSEGHETGLSRALSEEELIDGNRALADLLADDEPTSLAQTQQSHSPNNQTHPTLDHTHTPHLSPNPQHSAPTHSTQDVPAVAGPMSDADFWRSLGVQNPSAAPAPEERLAQTQTDSSNNGQSSSPDSMHVGGISPSVSVGASARDASPTKDASPATARVVGVDSSGSTIASAAAHANAPVDPSSNPSKNDVQSSQVSRANAVPNSNSAASTIAPAQPSRSPTTPTKRPAAPTPHASDSDDSRSPPPKIKTHIRRRVPKKKQKVLGQQGGSAESSATKAAAAENDALLAGVEDERMREDDEDDHDHDAHAGRSSSPAASMSPARTVSSSSPAKRNESPFDPAAESDGESQSSAVEATPSPRAIALKSKAKPNERGPLSPAKRARKPLTSIHLKRRTSTARELIDPILEEQREEGFELRQDGAEQEDYVELRCGEHDACPFNVVVRFALDPTKADPKRHMWAIEKESLCKTHKHPVRKQATQRKKGTTARMRDRGGSLAPRTKRHTTPPRVEDSEQESDFEPPAPAKKARSSGPLQVTSKPRAKTVPPKPTKQTTAARARARSMQVHNDERKDEEEDVVEEEEPQFTPEEEEVKPKVESATEVEMIDLCSSDDEDESIEAWLKRKGTMPGIKQPYTSLLPALAGAGVQGSYGVALLRELSDRPLDRFLDKCTPKLDPPQRALLEEAILGLRNGVGPSGSG